MSGHTIQNLQSVFVRLSEGRWSGILIGGQAVNLYAQNYAAQLTQIHDFEPLTSRDLDFHGGPHEARQAMRLLSASGKVNDGTDPSPNAGVLQVSLPSGEILVVDILTSVFGISASELIRSAISWQSSSLPGMPTIRTIHPLLLLESKLACLRTLPQRGRQDEKHVRLMLQVTHAWLQDQLQNPRAAFRAIERVAALMLTPDGLSAYERHAIDLWHAIPLTKMQSDRAFAEFFHKRLPQLRQEIDEKRCRLDN